jgi:hypothetical protein
MPTPNKGEHETDFISRCIGVVLNDGTAMDSSQAAAICHSKWSEHQKMAMVEQTKVSFDYDGTLSTDAGKNKAKRLIASGIPVYIISARNSVIGMQKVARELNIPLNRVYATGSNQSKVKKVLSLKITTHYDNNKDVVDQLPGVGKLI